MAALLERFGDAPSWQLKQNNYPPRNEDSYGYYLYFDPSGPTMREIRELIDSLQLPRTVILAPRNW